MGQSTNGRRRQDATDWTVMLLTCAAVVGMIEWTWSLV